MSEDENIKNELPKNESAGGKEEEKTVTGEIKEDTRLKEEKEVKGKKSGSLKRTILHYVLIAGIAAGAAIFLMNVVFKNAKVPTGSMKDTINENDRLIGLRLAYVTAEPQRGDVVIFKYPDDENTLFVKRVIGLPGETVSFKDGDVYIDGELLQEDYIKEPHSTMAVNETEYTVPENSYFVLGDNRRNSKDARFWTNTYVTKDKIEAKVLFRYYDGANNKISFSGF